MILAGSEAVFARDPSMLFWQAARVTDSEARTLLRQFKTGKIDEEKVLEVLCASPVADLGFANLDTHRALRKGFPEVVFGAGKTPKQLVQIVGELYKRHTRVLVTRIEVEQLKALKRKFPKAVYHEAARCVTLEKKPLRKKPGKIAVLCAGTSDIPVAEEAVVTLEIMGNQVERVYDVGVAGIHRVLSRADVIRKATVTVVVAGMEGALPSVVAGLTSRPVIAVPTSVGYGASFQGVAALLGMLNSCGSGVTVVNIDNGFGAGYAAAQINALLDG